MSAQEIIPKLWLGNIDAAEDPAFFKRFKITATINCTPDISCSMPGVEYLRIDVLDSLKPKDINIMTRELPKAVEFLHKKRDIEKRNVLVHCHAGMQRSCAVVVSYLCKYHAMNIENAVAHILKFRPVAFHHGHHINFIDSIRTYYTLVRGQSKTAVSKNVSPRQTPKSKTPRH